MPCILLPNTVAMNSVRKSIPVYEGQNCPKSFIKYQAIKTYKRTCTHTLGHWHDEAEWSVSSPSHFTSGMSLTNPQDKMMGGSQGCFGRHEDENFISLPRIQLQHLSHQASCLSLYSVSYPSILYLSAECILTLQWE
jgi:hypothetical protein